VRTFAIAESELKAVAIALDDLIAYHEMIGDEDDRHETHKAVIRILRRLLTRTLGVTP